MKIMARLFRWFGLVEDEALAPTGTDGPSPVPAPVRADDRFVADRFVADAAPDLRIVAAPTGDTVGGEWWVPRGIPVLATQPSDADDTVDESLLEQLERVIKSPEVDLPRLPRVAQRALALIGSENTNYRKLSELVSQDPVLSADVLRVANSVAFRGIREITTLEHAFSRLGTRELRSLILTRHMKGLVIKTGGAEKSLGEELWQRSLVSAVFMGHLAKRVRLAEDDAFLIGLLHDIGSLALLRIVHDHQKAHGRRVARPIFERLNVHWHEHLGVRLADEWNLPDPLPMLIGNHHGPVDEENPLRKQLMLIELSDVVCSMLGYATYVPYDFFNLPCVRRLELYDNPDTRQMLAQIPELVSIKLQAM
jgi:HD-like signal output (HDOD) protein